MDNKRTISSISICGEMTLNLHSLNNEGGEGNQIMTRQLTIVDGNAQKHTVTGISGDMFKHIHATHMVNYCNEIGISLSEYSKLLNPNRIAAEEIRSEAGKSTNNQADVINAVIKKCAVCDAHGLLITDKVGENKSSTNTPRKSVIEFAWTVGIPGKNNTETYVHTKLVADAGSKGSATSSNEGQNIFHRPANNGSYAFVCNIDTYRIGLNDINREYAIKDDERYIRYKAIMTSLLSSILNPQGAMTSVQKPHITSFKGVVTVSHNLIPAPTVSAINDKYLEEIEKIVQNLNVILPNAVELAQFNGFGELSNIFADLIEAKPYKIR